MTIAAATIALLHVLMYAAIIWYGWRSYRTWRKRSWFYIGIGFLVFLGYRTWRFVSLLLLGYYLPEDSSGFDTAALFIGTGFLLVGFRMLSEESAGLVKRLRSPVKPSAGDMPLEYWQERHYQSAVSAIKDTLKPELLK